MPKNDAPFPDPNARVHKCIAQVDSLVLISKVEKTAIRGKNPNDVRHDVPLNLLNLTALCHCNDSIERDFPTPIDFFKSLVLWGFVRSGIRR